MDIITFGSAVKALGEGKIGGHLVLYGDETTPDLSAHKDYFTAATEYDIESGDKRGMYWAHGQDPKIGVKKIGTLTVTPDDHGLWVEGVLNMADEYQRSIYALAEKGKLGWSSGAPSHLVTRKAIETKSGDTIHEILTWPIAEGSLTPTPADYRNISYTIKSLRTSLFEAPMIVENHTTKALPSGMSYDDLRSFLQDELNEDIGDDDDPYGPGLYICDIYDDAVVYRDDEDLFRISYTVTAGNDAVWGTPEAVVRTTVYQPATDGDDAADTNMVPMSGMMAGKQADVAALKAMLRDSMTLDDHASIVQDAMEGFAARAASLSDLSSTKAGRAMSAARHAKLTQIHAGMMTTHTAQAGHLAAMNDMLLSTDPNPDAKKDVDELDALRVQSLRLQSRQVQMTA